MPSQEVFPPRVRGCYLSPDLGLILILVSSSGTRMLLLDLCGEVLDEGFLLGYADATLYATQLAAEAGFPPRVRGCYGDQFAWGFYLWYTCILQP